MALTVTLPNEVHPWSVGLWSRGQGCNAGPQHFHSRGAHDIRMGNQKGIDLLPLHMTHELAVPDARYVHMGGQDAGPSHHRAGQRAPPCLIHSCISTSSTALSPVEAIRTLLSTCWTYYDHMEEVQYHSQLSTV